MTLLVHGMIAAGDAVDLDLPGLSAARGTEVSVLAAARVAALVSEVDGPEVLPTRALMLGHARLLEEVAARTTVVPMQFGVAVLSPDALTEDVLPAEAERLQASLERLAGGIELRLRGSYDEEAVVRVVAASDRRATRLIGRRDLASKMALGERIVAGIEGRRQGEVERVVAALRDHARAVASVAVAEPLDAFTLSFLVEGTQRNAFEQAVDALGEELTPLVRMELVGPLPPYSFAREEGAEWFD